MGEKFKFSPSAAVIAFVGLLLSLGITGTLVNIKVTSRSVIELETKVFYLEKKVEDLAAELKKIKETKK